MLSFKKKTLSEYATDIQTMAKAYRNQDEEVIEAVKKTMYTKYGNYVGAELDDTAYTKYLKGEIE